MKRFAPWFFVMSLAIFTAPALSAQDAKAPAQKSGAEKQAAAPATHPKPAHATTDPGLLQPATLKAKAPDVYEVKFVTTKGDFVVTVTREWAPLGADRFYNLVKHGFYNGASFFRVVPGFVVQFGLGPNPAVNKAWEKANIKDDPVKQSNKPGTITFATAGANTRTTQVFINFGNNAALDPQGFAPFGEVTTGMDVVKQLYSGYADQPTGKQAEITSGGKAYLEKNFPNLDSIKTATITSPTPDAAAPAKKAAAPSGGAAPKPQS